MTYTVTEVRARLLSAANDLAAAQPYGDGVLCTLPLTYSDDDSIRVLVERWAGGSGEQYRVTDRALTWDRLMDAGVNPAAGRAHEGFLHQIRSANFVTFGSEPSEIATICPADEVGAAMWAVGAAAMRAEQLRWLAYDRPRARYATRVVNRLDALAGARWQLQTSPRINLRSGRSRQITATVHGDRGTAFVQAVGLTSEPSTSVAVAYLNFDRSTVQRQERVSALAGRRIDWDFSLVDDLSSVSAVTFFEDANELEETISDIVGPARSEAPVSHG